MSNLITISGVRGFLDDNGTAQLHLEDVARGLGFVERKPDGSEYVRWGTVKDYLTELRFSQEVAKDGFVPENVFYRLAMKAKNDTAEKFQALVADEILPSIRKHGAYMTDRVVEMALQDPDTLIKLIVNLKEEREKRQQAEQRIEQQKPKVEFFDQVASSKDAIQIGHAAKVLGLRGVGRNKLFSILRERKVLMTDNIPYQEFIDRGYFRTVEQKWTTPGGETKISIKTLVYQRGLEYIRKLLREHTA